MTQRVTQSSTTHGQQPPIGKPETGSAILAKPFDVTDLAGMVREVLDEDLES